MTEVEEVAAEVEAEAVTEIEEEDPDLRATLEAEAETLETPGEDLLPDLIKEEEEVTPLKETEMAREEGTTEEIVPVDLPKEM